MASFLADIDRFFSVDEWKVQVSQCLGTDALEIETRTAEEPILSDRAFRAMYRGIYQTIDGTFAALLDGKEQCRLEAVDSSYWEISGPADF